ncbi:DUF4444 domain-containing protein [Rhodobacteraceae bacterium F11138]|nr:DUF4444 domain-containing protein [Rhodobacteraceae bacterium F11138]
MTQAPRFPPLLRGVRARSDEDPFEKACAMAAVGCHGGTLVHSVMADRLRAALVFAPEVALRDAMAMLPVCGLGFQNALGALAPPEVAVQLTWEGRILVNGGQCGGMTAAAPACSPDAVPDWLVVGLEVALMQTGTDPGLSPETTALNDEGCAGVVPVYLLESWARHTLVWINRWSEEGNQSLHEQWAGLLTAVGEPVACRGLNGTFLGVDEAFGMLLKDGPNTHLVPLTDLLEVKA